jgi:hypothetical protein
MDLQLGLQLFSFLKMVKYDFLKVIITDSHSHETVKLQANRIIIIAYRFRAKVSYEIVWPHGWKT